MLGLLLGQQIIHSLCFAWIIILFKDVVADEGSKNRKLPNIS